LPALNARLTLYARRRLAAEHATWRLLLSWTCGLSGILCAPLPAYSLYISATVIGNLNGVALDRTRINFAVSLA